MYETLTSAIFPSFIGLKLDIGNEYKRDLFGLFQTFIYLFSQMQNNFLSHLTLDSSTTGTSTFKNIFIAKNKQKLLLDHYDTCIITNCGLKFNKDIANGM